MGETVTRPVLEIAVCSPDEAEAAVHAGADRIELSCALEVGGITPSLGLFTAVRARVAVPVVVLVRPRAGGFVYNDSDFAVMCGDAQAFMHAGANGLVFGCVTPHSGIAREQCRRLVQIARATHRAHKQNGDAVFHRAFDFLTDRERALQTLIDLGFTRVLTSCGAASAEAATPQLSSLIAQAANRIEVLPAGRVRATNVAALVRDTRCSQVHAAPRMPVTDTSLAANSGLASGMGTLTGLDVQAVRELRTQLDQLEVP